MVTAENTGFAIHYVDASAEGGRPKIAFVVFQYGRHIVVAEAIFLLIGMLKTGKTVKLGVITVQTIESTDPKLVLTVFINTGNVTVAKAIGIFWAVFVHSHLLPVVTVQSIAGAQPDKAALILVNGFNGAIGEAVFVLDVFEVELWLLELSVSPGQ